MNMPKVLIVEDDHRSRKLLQDMLSAHGFDANVAVSAEDGIRLARELRPALVLMDLRLPGMDGFEAMESLRQDPVTREIPVVAVTASAMPQDRDRIMASGFCAYVPKPVRIRELLSLVRRLVDNPRHRNGEV